MPIRDALVVTAVRPFIVPTGQGRSFFFVAVDTDAGITGWGEGSQNDQDEAVAANVRQLAPRYVGADAFDLVERRGVVVASKRAGRAMTVAVSAIEQALWDAMGKAVGLPVYKLLGGAVRAEQRCYATMAWGVTDTTPDGLAAEALRLVKEGFAGVKVVAFAGGDLRGRSDLGGREGRRLFARAVDRVAAVRDAVGPDVDVMIECTFTPDRSQAAAFARAVAPCDPFWLEAPLVGDRPRDLARLRAALDIRIASGEVEHGRAAYRELFEAGAVDVVQPDPKWTGGVLEAKKVAAWAEACDVAVALHNNSGPVADAACAHLSVTLPNAIHLEVSSQRAPWEKAAVGATAVVVDGTVTTARLDERPGLGVEVDEAALVS